VDATLGKKIDATCRIGRRGKTLTVHNTGLQVSDPVGDEMLVFDRQQGFRMTARAKRGVHPAQRTSLQALPIQARASLRARSSSGPPRQAPCCDRYRESRRALSSAGWRQRGGSMSRRHRSCRYPTTRGRRFVPAPIGNGRWPGGRLGTRARWSNASYFPTKLARRICKCFAPKTNRNGRCPSNDA
jgi:hypothetical protein